MLRNIFAFLPAIVLTCVSGLGHAAGDQVNSLRVAAIQMVISNDVEENLSRILRGIAEAAESDARLVLFPETALSGFDRETIKQLDWSGLKQAMDAVAERAKENNVYVLYGCATQSDRERPYNSAVLIGPDGAEITRYHKLGPEPWFTPGDHLTLFEIDGIPCTAMVCHDERYPEVVRLPVLSGALACFYLSYEINSMEAALRKAEGYRAQLIARAVENGIWVCQANGIGPLGDSNTKSLGHSRIVSPDGVVQVEAPALVDTMIVEEIRPSDSGRGNALESLELSPVGDWWREGIKLVRHANSPRAELLDASSKSIVDVKNTVRLALMQTVPAKWELDKNFDVFLKMLDVASDEQAEVFVTPECWLDGYAAPDKSSTPAKLQAIAQPLVGSKYLDRVAAEARKRSMYICFGFTSLEDHKIFNASGLWNDHGELVGVYHKTHLQTHDLQYEFGRELPVWETPWGPLGIMICADRRWPETARTLRLQGARLILNPTYGMHHEANEWWMRTRSYENQCFIAFAHPNVGFVVDPKGNVLSKRDEQPGVLISDVDLSQATDDNHLRDRRPELYRAITDLK
ncbi:MAG: carbon-nitrogen hydrolase family protein [Planctomycetales bacterium]|nr:carbon-nitrogen hydrolase family protein [Planctomycetales bacterium]